MNNQDAVKLTRLVRSICPQQAFDEFTADTWAEMLADLRLQDCTEAVKNLGQRQPFIAVSDIRTEVRRIRRERLERMPALAPPDPDMSVAEYLEWVRTTRKTVADGGRLDVQRKQLRRRNLRFLEHTFRRVDRAGEGDHP